MKRLQRTYPVSFPAATCCMCTTLWILFQRRPRGQAKWQRASSAARRAAGERIPLIAGNGVSALVPEVLSERPEADVTFMFRPRAVYRNARIAVFRGGKQLAVKRARILAPGEMAEITVKQNAFCESEGELTVSVEEVGA